MAYRFVDFGAVVRDRPFEAREFLSRAFAACGGNASTIARLHEVNRSTVTRWCESLARRGYGDPRRMAWLLKNKMPPKVSEIPLDDVAAETFLPPGGCDGAPLES